MGLLDNLLEKGSEVLSAKINSDAAVRLGKYQTAAATAPAAVATKQKKNKGEPKKMGGGGVSGWMVGGLVLVFGLVVFLVLRK